MPAEPAYLRIASELRADIASGAMPAGAKLPSESALMHTHGVSRTVAKWAIAVLKGEGLVEGRPGSGTYVRSVPRLTRESPARNLASPTPPFASDAANGGRSATWEHRSVETAATSEIAARLAIEPGDPVTQTTYRFFADAPHPVQLSTSWEPLFLTEGTSVQWPEEGDVRGVVARMASIGVDITQVEERVITRPALPEEIGALGLPRRGTPILQITRTYFAADVPVETADIVLPSERYELVYRMSLA
ncbi:MAG: GntR family transcriptional regulator [Hamadaea sp.]|nr:GntR family transcriptional regulator [Hamadaea sp.]